MLNCEGWEPFASSTLSSYYTGEICSNLTISSHLLSVLKSDKLKLCCSLNYRADFCTVCHMLDLILMDKISNFLSIVLADLSIDILNITL